MGAMYRLKAYFGMVPAEEMAEYADEPVEPLRPRPAPGRRRPQRSARESPTRWDEPLRAPLGRRRAGRATTDELGAPPGPCRAGPSGRGDARGHDRAATDVRAAGLARRRGRPGRRSAGRARRARDRLRQPARSRVALR